MKNPTALIIGAGIGGLATAIQLARAGVEVTILEKNDKPGGRCRQIIKDGHIFDTGPTMYLFPELFEDFFSSIGENRSDHIPLLRCDPTYLLSFTDNTVFTLSSDAQKMKAQLEKHEPGSSKNFDAFVNATRQHYEFAMSSITTKDLRYPWDYFTLSNLYFTIKHKALYTHYYFTSKFFKNPYLRAVFTFQDSYLGLHPYQSPSLFSLLSYVEYAQGNYLPEGGMYKIIQALENITRKYNITIHYKKSVKQIQTKKDTATAVICDDNTTYSADYIICNADLSYAYNNLLNDDPYKKKLQNKKYSCSVMVFHWGLDITYPVLNTHNIFFSHDYKKGFDGVINQTHPPTDPHIYIQAPSRTDPSRAPLGQDTLSVMIPINHIYPHEPIDWSTYKEQVREYVFNRLDKAGVKDIKSHIKFEISYSPPDWQNYLNLPYGSVYGLHHSIMQLGYLRPKRTHSKYKNLFFVGSSTHPGSGLPTVLLSSQFTAHQIIEKRCRKAK